jgi:pimeloyl-ACP methyl ester carboxylesterase
VIAKFGLTTANSISGPVSLQDVTVRCGDAWAIMNPATVSRQGPSVFASQDIVKAKGWRALCAVWPHEPGVSGTVRSTVPIVFLNGTADEGDPPANVAGATATMPNALLVSVPGVGHWTLNWNPDPTCLLAATTAFIQAGRPASPAAWHACTRALASEPMPFPAP